MTQAALATISESVGDVIRSAPCPRCYLCQTPGEPLYDRLSDRLFGALGEWNIKRCSNRECGLVWLDPMPLEEDISKAYANYFTHEATAPAAEPPPSSLRHAIKLMSASYIAHRFHIGEAAGKPLRWLLALPITLSRIKCDELEIPLRYLVSPKGRMLDVGCGDGSVLKLAQELGWNAEGVDFDTRAVDTARRKGLAVKLGRLTDQHYRDESFDLVLMNNVIEHIHDPLATLAEIHRVLRPGGSFLITTPNVDSWGSRHFGINWVHLDPPRHLHLFNSTNLRALVQKAGFETKTVASTLRWTAFTFEAGMAIRRVGRINDLWRPTFSEKIYGRGGSAVQMLIRTWDHMAADELLLEAYK